MRGWSTRQQRIAYHRIARRYRPRPGGGSPPASTTSPSSRSSCGRRRNCCERCTAARRSFAAWWTRPTASRPRSRSCSEAGRTSRPTSPRRPAAPRSRAGRGRAHGRRAPLPLPVRARRPAPERPVGDHPRGARPSRCAAWTSEPALGPLGPAAFVDENHLSREGSASVAAALRTLLPGRSMPEALGAALADARGRLRARPRGAGLPLRGPR